MLPQKNLNRAGVSFCSMLSVSDSTGTLLPLTASGYLLIVASKHILYEQPQIAFYPFPGIEDVLYSIDKGAQCN